MTLRPGTHRPAGLRALSTVLFLFGASLSTLAAAPPAPAGRACVHHDLDVRIDPARGRLEVRDRITFPVSTAGRPVAFLLHEGLELSCETEGARLRREGRPPRPGDFTFVDVSRAGKPLRRPGASDLALPDAVPSALYVLDLPAGRGRAAGVTLRYAGPLQHPVTPSGPEYARGFSETPGTVDPRGVYLCGRSLWVPWFGDGLVAFDLAVTLPGNWDAVSQGERTAHEVVDGRRRTAWRCADPAEEIYLVAGPFTEYAATGDGLTVVAFLRTPDGALARRYLDATVRYAALYRSLIGPFPYRKFALVENYWETGYGMPSFTLLGEKVIRLPFILHSSYPHELLHNYWGNSVFVDMAGGNWCEGLTTYLADHLIAQQKGQDTDYRRTTLQKYADYVKPEGDVPLTRFRERRDAVTEALGYGKSMMVFHMLRTALGDDSFRKALGAFYASNRFRRASWGDLRAAFTAASGRDLRAFFRQWVDRPGAPDLRLSDVFTRPVGRGFSVSFRLTQAQAGPPYRLDVPVAVTLEGAPDAVVRRVTLDGPARDFTLTVPGRPLRIDVDPAFDLFRRLDPRETPPSISRLLGAAKIWLALPVDADTGMLRAWRELAEGWVKDSGGKVAVCLDTELSELPSDAAVWALGWENRLVPKLAALAGPYGAQLTPRVATLGGREVPRAGRCVVTALPHPASPSLAVGWMAADSPNVVAGLGRKVPHYGKYGWLVFEGGEPVNVGKGAWPAMRSPLTAVFDPAVSAAAFPPMGKLPPGRALADLPSSFTVAALKRHVEALTDPALEGRAFGSPGLDAAGDHVALAFQAAGLQPAGDTVFFQSFAASCRDGEPAKPVKNVLGLLPGKDPTLAEAPVLVCAHYDHLGRGYPLSHPGNAGKIHPGADDNASGVAVLLELARVMAEGERPDRPVLFAAFTGEECGMVGSRHLIAAGKPFAVEKMFAVLNLDTVGRLGAGRLLVLGASTAREWPFILMGAGYVTGLAHDLVNEALDSSDQAMFAAKGVPALHLFTPPHPDYHTPADTADKVDYAGLAKVAEYTSEITGYLAGRKDALTVPQTASAEPGESRGAEAGPPAAAGGPPAGARRVGIGIVPDFAFQGAGVRVGAVTEGGPAAAAGFRAGDVIVAVGFRTVSGLKEYTEALKTLTAGQGIDVTVDREGRPVKLHVVPKPR